MKPERVQFHKELLPDWEFEIATEAERKAAKQEFDEDLPKYKAIRRSFLFSCFPEAMAFVDRVADLGWDMGVEPGIYVHTDYVNIRIPGNGKGLSEADFNFAKNVDRLVC